MPGPTSFLVTGDIIQLQPPLMPIPAVLIPPPLPMPLVVGKSKNTAGFRPITKMGDQAQWAAALPPAAYTAGPYVIPGIMKPMQIILDPSNISKKVMENGVPVLLVGAAPFTVMWQVVKPAQLPPPVATPDPVPMYTGKGTFIQPADSKAMGG